ncbi:MAG TPA: YihY/virulence factor BrkB family protein [Polyangiaceae bacterium]|nr:YihY/virulence factor BrkB family protein [Polyangiaceae bacterium]
MGEIWATVKETVNDWLDDGATSLAAALAYYSLLSLAPLLVISVAVAGLFFGQDAARGRVAGELGAVVGTQAAQGIQSVVASAQSPVSGLVSTIVGVITLFIGASGVFSELQSSLNTIWEVKRKPGRGVWGEIKDRFWSFSMVLGVAFLLLVSLLLNSVLSAVGATFSPLLPGGELVWQGVNALFSLSVITGLFALIFKYVPDAEIRWRDVWLGAGVTALLFTIGKLLLGLYLGKAAIGSSYGAAGSLIALVVWVYYAAQILLLGAEFTQVQARRSGREIRPARDALAVQKTFPSAAEQR